MTYEDARERVEFYENKKQHIELNKHEKFWLEESYSYLEAYESNYKIRSALNKFFIILGIKK